MKLSPEHLEQFERFLDRIKGETYPEPSSNIHEPIIASMVPQTLQATKLAPGSRVLDVGCGKGQAIELFRDAGFDAVGVTLNDEDRDACVQRGLDVRVMDQSFLDFPPASFDLVWCRHCLEHSIFPYFTLAGFARVLKPQGWLYVEVPAPDTACHHETNQNHYSVMSRSMWVNLMLRAGFKGFAATEHRPHTQAGPDVYWAFLLRRAD